MEQWSFAIPGSLCGHCGLSANGKVWRSQSRIQRSQRIHAAAQAAQSNVAKRLQETRLKCGLKQQDVAERTGINVVTLSGYEIGKNEPNMEALVSLADVYGVTLDYLMCRTDS